MLKVTQLSDTHFSTTGTRSHGGLGYDTDETYEAVFASAFGGGAPAPDLVVITGDIADHGRPDEYAKAVSALERIATPIGTWPGNHDFHIPFEVGVPRAGITMSRTQRVGSWLFVFADSNHEGRERGPDGVWRDHPDRADRANGMLGRAEAAWLGEVLDANQAENVFIWVHHPPAMPGAFTQPAYDAELTAILAAHPEVRGIGAGHVHTDLVAELEGRPVFVCPSLTVNFDLDTCTLLPPGYRTYTFADDGSVTSTCHLVDDDRWPRVPLPEVAMRYLMGEISWGELQQELGIGD